MACQDLSSEEKKFRDHVLKVFKDYAARGPHEKEAVGRFTLAHGKAQLARLGRGQVLCYFPRHFGPGFSAEVAETKSALEPLGCICCEWDEDANCIGMCCP